MRLFHFFAQKWENVILSKNWKYKHFDKHFVQKHRGWIDLTELHTLKNKSESIVFKVMLLRCIRYCNCCRKKYLVAKTNSVILQSLATCCWLLWDRLYYIVKLKIVVGWSCPGDNGTADNGGQVTSEQTSPLLSGPYHCRRHTEAAAAAGTSLPAQCRC